MKYNHFIGMLLLTLTLNLMSQFGLPDPNDNVLEERANGQHIELKRLQMSPSTRRGREIMRDSSFVDN